VEGLSRKVFSPHRQGSVGNPELLCLILPYSPRTTRILRSLLNCTRPLSSPRCHRRLTLPCLSPKPSVSAPVSSGPFPGHACRRSASSLDQKQKAPLGQTSTALGLVGGTRPWQVCEVPATPRDFFPLALEIRHCISLLFVHEQAGCHAAVPERFRAKIGCKTRESCSLEGVR
jgi:hypothetical protein